MPFRSMEQGINAIQQGNLEEGGRLLKIALRNPELKGSLRATALAWLAETRPARQEKIEIYREALAADPDNATIQRRLSALLEQDLPPVPPPPLPPEVAPPASTPPPAAVTPPGGIAPVTVPAQAAPTMPATPLVTDYSPPVSPIFGVIPAGNGAPAAPITPVTTALNTFYRTVGIVDGPNGPATAFFVTRDGLLATTRYAVGGVENLTLELEAGRQIPGQVVRSFPELDLAILYTGLAVNQLLPVSQNATVPENTVLNAIVHGGRVIPGQRRTTQSVVKPDWFPTTMTQLFDAGGNPIFDDRNFLVGMLTRNANRSSPYVYGLHVGAIYRAIDHYAAEVREGGQRVYCPGCGYLSRAASLGGFYCEVCGSTLSTARQTARFPLPMPQVQALYGENIHRPCPNCQARIGYYNGHCLRCGYELR